MAVYWMGPAIAHTFLSFAFAGDDHLAISIETRKEKGEGYSTVKGFFRQYELYYVVADERDVVRLRTNYRHDPPEDVYLYRMLGPTENGRRVFLGVHERDQRAQGPARFYNTLTSNCTTAIWYNTSSMQSICRSAGNCSQAAMCPSICMKQGGSTPASAFPVSGNEPTSMPALRLRTRRPISPVASDSQGCGRRRAQGTRGRLQDSRAHDRKSLATTADHQRDEQRHAVSR